MELCEKIDFVPEQGDVILKSSGEIFQRENRFAVYLPERMQIDSWTIRKVEFSDISISKDNTVVNLILTIDMASDTYKDIAEKWKQYANDDERVVIIKPLEETGAPFYVFELKKGEVEAIKFSTLDLAGKGFISSYTVRLKNLFF